MISSKSLPSKAFNVLDGARSDILACCLRGHLRLKQDHAAALREDVESCVVSLPERERLGEKLAGFSLSRSVGSRF